MQISLVSDIHLEFHPAKFRPEDEGDVLILAGDICVADDIKRFPFFEDRPDLRSPYPTKFINSQVYCDFFTECAKRFNHVLYVSGNHEHYSGKMDETYDILKSNLAKVSPNIHLLESETFKVEHVTFFGATFWTDFDRNPTFVWHAQQNMSDYQYIRWGASGGYRKIKGEDLIRKFEQSRKALHLALAQTTGDMVVISHHAPCPLSTPPHYKGNALQSAYSSMIIEDLEEVDTVPIWCHGHIHSPSDYEVYQTRVLCQPRGYYGHEHAEEYLTLKIFEI